MKIRLRPHEEPTPEAEDLDDRVHQHLVGALARTCMSLARREHTQTTLVQMRGWERIQPDAGNDAWVKRCPTGARGLLTEANIMDPQSMVFRELITY
jgi:hypothetical protein